LKRLDKTDSNKYQEFAETLAAIEGVARVHLDMVLWLMNRQRPTSLLRSVAEKPAQDHRTAEHGDVKRVDEARGEEVFEANTESRARRHYNNEASNATAHLGRLTTSSREFKNRVLEVALKKTQREAMEQAAKELGVYLPESYLTYPGAHIYRWRQQGYPK
jgi:hypothetical protein